MTRYMAYFDWEFEFQSTTAYPTKQEAIQDVLEQAEAMLPNFEVLGEEVVDISIYEASDPIDRIAAEFGGEALYLYLQEHVIDKEEYDRLFAEVDLDPSEKHPLNDLRNMIATVLREWKQEHMPEARNWELGRFLETVYVEVTCSEEGKMLSWEEVDEEGSGN